MKVESHIRKRRMLWHKILMCLVVVAVILSVSYLLRSDNFKITSVHADGAFTIASQVLEESIKNELAGSYLGVLPKSNIFIYPKSKIQHKLESDYPVIASVSISAGLSGELEVQVREHSQAYFICHADLNCEVLVKNLEAKGLLVKEVVFDEINYGGNASIAFTTGWKLVYATSTNPNLISERLTVALDSEALKGKDLGTLEYIDMRLANKIFYKFINVK